MGFFIVGFQVHLFSVLAPSRSFGRCLRCLAGKTGNRPVTDKAAQQWVLSTASLRPPVAATCFCDFALSFLAFFLCRIQRAEVFLGWIFQEK
jgi:hypothetical protein